jgi:hypothetical protein
MLTSQRRRMARRSCGEARERRDCCCARAAQNLSWGCAGRAGGAHAGRARREREGHARHDRQAASLRWAARRCGRRVATMEPTARTTSVHGLGVSPNTRWHPDVKTAARGGRLKRKHRGTNW